MYDVAIMTSAKGGRTKQQHNDNNKISSITIVD
jgi:hypothetical protein